MTPIGKKLLDLRDCLYRILDNPVESAKQTTNIAQQITVDDETLKGIAETRANVFIINSAQVNAQIISESGKALKYLDDIRTHFDEFGSGIDHYLSILIKNGWNLDAIESMVRRKCFEIAEKTTNTQKQTAKKLGINRTTYLERRKQYRREEDKTKNGG